MFSSAWQYIASISRISENSYIFVAVGFPLGYPGRIQYSNQVVLPGTLGSTCVLPVCPDSLQAGENNDVDLSMVQNYITRS